MGCFTNWKLSADYDDGRAINRRLDGAVENSAEYESRSVLTIQEEDTLVRYLKNMNRCNQGVSRKGCEEVIIKMLELRRWGINKRKKRFRPLSMSATTALEKRKISRLFWRRFDSEHSDITKKRQGNVSILMI